MFQELGSQFEVVVTKICDSGKGEECISGLGIPRQKGILCTDEGINREDGCNWIPPLFFFPQIPKTNNLVWEDFPWNGGGIILPILIMSTGLKKNKTKNPKSKGKDKIYKEFKLTRPAG